LEVLAALHHSGIEHERKGKCWSTDEESKLDLRWHSPFFATSSMISSWYQFHPYHQPKPAEVTWLITDDGSDETIMTKPIVSWSMTNPLLTTINNERYYYRLIVDAFELLRKQISDKRSE
jgi:hypothetical protein